MMALTVYPLLSNTFFILNKYTLTQFDIVVFSLTNQSFLACILSKSPFSLLDFARKDRHYAVIKYYNQNYWKQIN